MKTYRKNFRKIVYGYMDVLADSEEEAQSKLDEGAIDNEFDNKSEYEYEEWEQQ